MKRILTAALLSSGIVFAAGAAPASADPGYGRGEIHRDGGFRDGGRDGLRDGGRRVSMMAIFVIVAGPPPLPPALYVGTRVRAQPLGREALHAGAGRAAALALKYEV